MKVEEVVEELRFLVRDLKNREVTSVEVEKLGLFVEFIEREAQATPEDVRREVYRLEEYRSRREDWVSRRDRTRRRDEQMPAYTVATGEQALKALLAINGGAAIALLAFFGTFAKSAELVPIPISMANALAAFVAGVLAAALGFGTRFFSQAGFGGEFGLRSRPIGKWGRRAAITFGAIAMLAFTLGGWLAASGVREQSRATHTPTNATLPVIPVQPAGTISHELPMPRPPYIENQEVKPKE